MSETARETIGDEIERRWGNIVLKVCQADYAANRTTREEAVLRVVRETGNAELAEFIDFAA